MEKGGCKETITHCTDIGTHLHIIAAYLPWINDLLEQNNCILLNASKQLCVPNQGEDEDEKMDMTDIPKNWPDHLDAAIKNLSDCIFPSLKFSPNKLLINIPTIISPSMDPEDITLLRFSFTCTISHPYYSSFQSQWTIPITTDY